MPFVAVGGLPAGEVGAQAAFGGRLGCLVGAAESERERVRRRVPAACSNTQLAGLQDVAVGRRVVVGIELPIVSEVGPPVAYADEAIRRALEAVCRHERGVGVTLTGKQSDAPSRTCPRRGVAARGVVDRRVV